eukprot:scaffold112264_cov32-Tisochrysis_lutea.AAC.4
MAQRNVAKSSRPMVNVGVLPQQRDCVEQYHLAGEESGGVVHACMPFSTRIPKTAPRRWWAKLGKVVACE